MPATNRINHAAIFVFSTNHKFREKIAFVEAKIYIDISYVSNI